MADIVLQDIAGCSIISYNDAMITTGMEFRIRDGRPSDIDDIVEIYRQKKLFLSMAWASRGEEVQQHYIKNLRMQKGHFGSHPDLKVLIAERKADGKALAYLLVFLDFVEAITGEKQGLVFDYGVSGECHDSNVIQALLSRAEAAVLEKKMKYIVIELFHDDVKSSEEVEKAGYRREIHRIIKKAEFRPVKAPEPDPFTVRKGCSEDIFFVLWLNTQCAAFIIPSGRERPHDEVQFRFLGIYSGMSLAEREEFTSLIIEDRIKDISAGYLLFKTSSSDVITGDRLGYIYDIAIHPDYWGRRATQRLMREGENYMAEKGMAYLLGDISDNNQRALKTAIKSIGFSPDRIRWMKRLTADRPESTATMI